MTRKPAATSLDQMVLDLRPYFRSVVVAFAKDDDKDDGDDKNDGEKDEGGEGGSATGADDKSKESGGTGTKDDDVKDPDKKRLSEEAARHRVAAKSEKERADAAEAKLRELEDKDKSELEKVTRDRDELQGKVEKQSATIADQALRLAFFESGASALFKNPVTARKLLDLSALKADEDGQYDAKEVKALADALLKAEPYLAADGSGSEGSTESGGSPNNGRKTKDADREALKKKFPALANR